LAVAQEPASELCGGTSAPARVEPLPEEP